MADGGATAGIATATAAAATATAAIIPAVTGHTFAVSKTVEAVTAVTPSALPLQRR